MVNPLVRILHITTWLPAYSWGALRGDVVAGLTVGVMLIPQAMAYALLAGVPPIYGLYASLVPLLVYPFFGTSRHLAVGIVAIDMVIMAVGLSALAEPGSARYIGLAVLLAMMVGAIQMLMGAARLGFVVNLLSRPVIVGFTSGAVLTIGLGQLGNLLGIELSQTQHVFTLLADVVQRVAETRLLSLMLGAGAIAMLIGLRRWQRFVPGSLIVVVLGILVTWWFGFDRQGVAVVGSVPGGLPVASAPAFNMATVRALVPTAAALVLVQFMSVISLGKAFAARHRYWIRPNRELFAMGAANFVGSWFRGLPVSGSFSRTALNEQAGARTSLANIVAAGLVGLTLLFLTPLFYYLPVSVLAAVIMVAVFALMQLREMRYLFKAKRIDGGLALLTFAATLGLGIQEGILTGVVASVVAIMYRISRPHVAILGHLPDTRSFRDIDRLSQAQPIEGIFMLRVDASFSFANAEYLKDILLKESQAEDSPVRAIIIDASTMNDLDTTAVGVLMFVAETLRSRGVGLYISGLKGPAKDVVQRSGLEAALGTDHFFLSPHRAVKHILAEWGRLDEYLESVPHAEQPAD